MIQLSSRMVFASVSVCLATALLLASPLTERQSSNFDRSDSNTVADATQKMVRLRIDYKMAIAEDLVHGTIDLRTATAEFLRINIENDVTMSVIRDRYEGKTDFEKMARNVLDYARQQIASESKRDRGAIKDRLSCELEEIIHEGV